MILKKCRYVLIPFSFVYFLLIFLRDIFYRFNIFKRYRLNAVVISVGNLTWGGTGKTPAVLFIAGTLLKQGRKIAILTRGYGGDEERLFSELVPGTPRIGTGYPSGSVPGTPVAGTPVVLGADRIKNGREAIARYSADTLVLDDGFQYRRLDRDLDIVCIDAANPFGNGCVIPAGSLREGLSALNRADVFLITRADLAVDLDRLEQTLSRINPDALIVKSIHSPQNFYKLSNSQLVDPASLNDKKIALVSAIGSPLSFEKTVLKLGLRFEKHFMFRDHHWYRRGDVEKIKRYCLKNNIDTLITTEKDAVRFKALSYQPSVVSFLVMSIKLEIIDNEQEFYNRLFRVYNS